MYYITPRNVLAMLNWEEIEIRAVGEKTVDIEKLKKITIYSGCSESTPVVKLFWQVFEEMSEENKGLYLKYVWGR
jgi:CRISPR/Cas system-associated endonuclease Cas1